jgi:uncharacterized integral membrane protein
VTAFLAFLVLAVLYAALWKLRDMGFAEGWLMPLIVLLVGSILTGLNFCAQECSARLHHQELFGKNKRQERTAEKGCADVK